MRALYEKKMNKSVYAEECCINPAASFSDDYVLWLENSILEQISKAYDAGAIDASLSLMFDNPKGRYISNLKFEL